MLYLILTLMVFWGFFPSLAVNIGLLPIFWIVCVALAAVAIFKHRNTPAIPGWKPYVLFAAALLLSQIQAVRPRETFLQTLAFASFWAAIPFAAVWLREARYRQYVVYLSGIGVLLYCLYTLVYGDAFILAGVARIGPMGISLNDIGFRLAVGGAFVWGIVHHGSGGILKKLFGIIVIVLAFYVLLFYVGSRGGFLGLVLGGFMSRYLVQREQLILRRWLSAIFIIGIFLGAGYYLLVNEMLPATVQRRGALMIQPEADGSFALRVSFAKKAWLMFLDYPITGGGWDNFRYYQYAQVSSVIRDAYIYVVTSDRHWPHSIYLKIMGEVGLPGIIGFLGILSGLWKSYRKISIKMTVFEKSEWIWLPTFLFFAAFHDAFNYLTILYFMLLQGQILFYLWPNQNNSYVSK